MKLRLQNFEAHGDTTFDIDKGLVFVIGPNSVGKSSIRKALEGLIDNETGDSFIKDGADESKVTLELDGNTITWIKRRKGSPKMAYMINGTKHTKIGRGAFNELLKFGLNRLNGSEPDSVLLNVWREWGAPFLLGVPDTQKFGHLSRIMKERGLYDIIRQCAADMKKATHSTVQVESVLKEQSIRKDAKEMQIVRYDALDNIGKESIRLEQTTKILKSVVSTTIDGM